MEEEPGGLQSIGSQSQTQLRQLSTAQCCYYLNMLYVKELSNFLVSSIIMHSHQNFNHENLFKILLLIDKLLFYSDAFAKVRFKKRTLPGTLDP